MATWAPRRISAIALALVLLLPAVALGGDDPKITSGPAIAGAPRVGQTLTAEATWEGDGAVAVYEWYRCSGNHGRCNPIAGGDDRTYDVVAADAGFRLLVRFTVTSAEGSDSETSDRTREVLAPVEPTPTATPTPEPMPTPAPTPEPSATPVPTPTATPGRTAAPAPLATLTGALGPAALATALPVPAPNLGATVRGPRMLAPFPRVRIRGRTIAGGALVTLLTVRAPRGARIVIRCYGRACPARRWASTVALRRVARLERMLPAGTRIAITVTRRGRIGKHTTIVIRRGKAPRRVDRCLYPGASRPVPCPA